MAIQATYKKFKRGQRQANVETDFTSGMMFSEGAVSEGYVKTLVNFDFTQDGRDALKPRAALTTCEIMVPDMVTQLSPADNALYLNPDTCIKYSKECIENGVEYRQFILGKPDETFDEVLNKGKIFAFTSRKSISDFNDVVTSAYDMSPASAECSFYNTDLTEIHGVELVSDAKTAFPVGTFMGNSFYFFSDSSDGILRNTKFYTDRYDFVDAPVKEPTASEAVNYGYNMLLGSDGYSNSDPYTFKDKTNGSTVFEMEGILPYDSKFDVGTDPKLLMSPRANSRVWFRCNYDAPTSKNYAIVWSWKEVSADDWTVFNTDWTNSDPFNSTGTPVLQADLICPSKEILIRCEAYDVNDITGAVEKAMTVGFDFTLDSESTTRNTQQETYDLSTATGMMSWKNRLVLWGVPKDPTILFISDLEDPGYFPYPNNITVFDEPIIAVVQLMDTLVVFTRSKVHQVALNEDGTSWTSTVIQSNLYIEAWDKHLIQTVRNMVYFKSGNYYYMLVPKAQSTTGELTLAPITTPITDFFNHFKRNVTEICKACFKTVEDDGTVVSHWPEDMVTYYNFIDYENIHNFYVYKVEESYVHFDIIYNTVHRYWKINVYESSHFLYPFRNDATQNGIMAGTTIIDVIDTSPPGSDESPGESDAPEESPGEESDGSSGYNIIKKRIIQLFKFDPLVIEDIYIMAGVDFIYSSTFNRIIIDAHNETLYLPDSAGDVSGETLTVASIHVRPSTLPDEILTLCSLEDYVGGFNRMRLYDTIQDNAEALKDSTIFSNRQMLDTGYRDANLFINKRYRELQLQINNIDNVDMEFGMDFQIAGEQRNTDFLYEVSQTIDEYHQDEGIAYLDATPYMPIPINDELDGNTVNRTGEIDKTNLWTLKHSLDPDISLWKVRAAVSGKGTAPRLRLFTKNSFDYQLLGINWVYREMNMR